MPSDGLVYRVREDFSPSDNVLMMGRRRGRPPTDHMPHVREAANGVLCALGMERSRDRALDGAGELVAQRFLRGRDEEMVIAPTPMPSVVFHEFRNAGVAVATLAKATQDRFDRAVTRISN